MKGSWLLGPFPSNQIPFIAIASCGSTENNGGRSATVVLYAATAASYSVSMNRSHLRYSWYADTALHIMSNS